MKKIIIIFALLLTTYGFAQKERTLKLNEKTNLIEVVYFHDNGSISQTGFYTQDGKLQGEWISYNEKGEKIVLANYQNGVKVGKWLYWIDGNIKEVNYDNNAIANIN